MSNDLLKRLYWPCSDECGNYMHGCNLGELYQRTEDTAQASDRMTGLLDRLALDKNAVDQLTALYCDIMNAYEQQGFINGLRMGAQLVRELTPAADQRQAAAAPEITARGEAQA